MRGYAEPAAAINFSFLRGASQPADRVAQAISLGLQGIGIADRNTVAGVVRAHVALRKARAQAKEDGLPDFDFRFVTGARLAFADGTPDIIAYPATRLGWGRLTRLLTTRSEEHTSELQSLMRISYAVFCLQKQTTTHTPHTPPTHAPT